MKFSLWQVLYKVYYRMLEKYGLNAPKEGRKRHYHRDGLLSTAEIMTIMIHNSHTPRAAAIPLVNDGLHLLGKGYLKWIKKSSLPGVAVNHHTKEGEDFYKKYSY